MAWESRRTYRPSHHTPLPPVHTLLKVYNRERLLFYPENEALGLSEMLDATYRNAQCHYF
jgi:hypothetical protein